MSLDVELDDAAMQQDDEQPKAKRKLSRLAHMTVNKSAAGEDQELLHKSSAATAGFGSPYKAAKHQEALDRDLEDADNDAAVNLDNSTAPVNLNSASQQEQHSQSAAQQPQPLATATHGLGALTQETPAVSNPASAGVLLSKPEESMIDAAATEPPGAATRSTATLQPHRVNLDDESDDEWEDQPAPVIQDAADTAEDVAGASISALQAADSAAQHAAEYDPTSRRREQYDDEDEWEELVIKEKVKGTQAGSASQQDGEEEQGSASNSGSEEENDILAGDPDETNAATQRLLRDSAARDGLGKGFKPEVAPLNSLLGKLAARQAALEAKAKQRAPIMEQQQQQAALTLEQLKAHLEQHSIGTKQPHKQHDAQMAAADEAPDAADGGSQQADVGHGDIELDASDDELMIEPAQQQPRGDPIVAAMLPPDTQELLAELPPRQPGAGGIIAGSEVCAGTATELDLQLGDDGDEDNNAGDNSKGSQGDEDMQDAAGDCSEGEADGSGSGEEELLDSSEVGSGSESETDNSEEQQQSEDLAEPEPLHWEEEEQEAGPTSSSQQEGAGVEAIKNRKGGKSIRRRGAAGGFIDAEADLSDDEGHDEDGESDDEGYEEDAMLADLIREVKEGRMDETRRADLHSKWLAGKDAKEMKDLLDALKRGFKRKRKAGAGLDDDDDDGTDAEARRRRAQLLGTWDDAEEDDDEAAPAGTDRLKRLDFQWQEQEDDMQAAAAALAAELANREKQRKIQDLQLQASESQDGVDVMQLLHMDVDEDSQHTAALLSKSASAPAAVPGAAAPGSSEPARASVPIIANSLPAQARQGGGSKLRNQSGPAKEPGAAAVQAGGSAGGFTFQMFGKDLTNSGKQQPAKQQVAGSFIGRSASNSVTVRAASNYGASRSFVFGSDPSNYSNPAAKEQQGDAKAGAAAATGPSSFAGLGKLIAESAHKGTGYSRLGQGVGAAASQDSTLLSMLGKKGPSNAAVGGSARLHMDAVGTKFKAVGNKGGDGNTGTSRGGPWQF